MDHEHDRRQLERLTFFSDAVFAIAMTLLVVEVHVPHVDHHDNMALAQGLVDLLPNYIGFLVSFMVVGRFWVAHHTVFALLKGTSPRRVWVNVLLLLVVAFMPFPTAVFSNYVQLRAGVGLYTGWLALLGLMNRALIRTALRDRTLVRDDVDQAVVAMHMRNSWIPLAIAVIGFVAGMIEPVFAAVALVIASPLVSILVHRLPIRSASPG